jgi:hypothetical protein
MISAVGVFAVANVGEEERSGSEMMKKTPSLSLRLRVGESDGTGAIRLE